MTGIALQSWEQYGWSGKPGEVYWLWRDRKGLMGNPLSLLANVVFVYGVATALWTRADSARLHAWAWRRLTLQMPAHRRPDGLRGARLRSAVRARRAGARGLRECAERRRDVQGAGRLCLSRDPRSVLSNG